MLNTPSVMSSLRCAAGSVAEDLARGVDVLVREHLDRGAAQAAAVDDAGVIELVGDDDVVLGEDRRHRAGVGGEAALEDDDRLDLLELGEARVRARCGSPSCPAIVRTDPEPTPRRSMASMARALQRRMSGQPEIVVRGEVDDRAAVDDRAVRLFAAQLAQRSPQALRAEGIELGGEVGERIRAHARSIGTRWPDRASRVRPSRLRA